MRWYKSIGELALALGLVVLVMNHAPPKALGKMIICLMEWIEPVAPLSDDGRHIQLGLGTRGREFEDGTVAHVTAIVYQESTGAYGIHVGKVDEAGPDDPEESITVRDVRAIGRERFEEGPATACYFVEARHRGKVVVRTSHCDEVLLVHEIP